MEPIRRLLDTSDVFREAVTRLIGLPSEEMSRLRELTQESFSTAAGRLMEEGWLGLAETETYRTVLALDTIYSTQRELGSEPEETAAFLVQHLRASMGLDDADVPARVNDLAELLRARPQLDRIERNVDVQSRVFPLLQGVGFGLDLRVAPLSPGTHELVPVVIARLTFDEPPQVGHSVAFQLTDESLQALDDELAKIRDLLDEVRGQYLSGTD